MSDRPETTGVTALTAALQALARFTEYQLATLEGLPARTPQARRERHQKIADEMVQACRAFAIRPDEFPRKQPCTPRLSRILEQIHNV